MYILLFFFDLLLAVNILNVDKGQIALERGGQLSLCVRGWPAQQVMCSGATPPVRRQSRNGTGQRYQWNGNAIAVFYGNMCKFCTKKR